MSISERYREVTTDIEVFCRQLRAAIGAEAKEMRQADKALTELSGLRERVGEVPRIRLEAELTPVLLKAHSHLDGARVLFEEAGEEDRAAAVWELEQKLYRLLNDL